MSDECPYCGTLMLPKVDGLGLACPVVGCAEEHADRFRELLSDLNVGEVKMGDVESVAQDDKTQIDDLVDQFHDLAYRQANELIQLRRVANAAAVLVSTPSDEVWSNMEVAHAWTNLKLLLEDGR